jgi:hypothetical protein
MYFNRVKRITNANGYTDIYKGKAGQFKLVINSIKKEGNYTTGRNGMLYLRAGKIVKTLSVYGLVLDNDSINRKLFGY